MDKAPDAYRTISEVATDLDLPQHVLRFWETRFAQIRPLKRGGGRRYYRPEDIDLLKGVRHLLYGEGYTIRGVQRIIKENGVKSIQALGRGEGAASLPKPKGPDIVAPEAPPRAPLGGLRTGLGSLFRREARPAEPDPAGGRIEPGFDTRDAIPQEEDREFGTADEPFERRSASPDMDEESAEFTAEPDHPGAGDAASRNGESPAGRSGPPELSADDLRRLQAALVELAECRRTLDEIRRGR